MKVVIYVEFDQTLEDSRIRVNYDTELPIPAELVIGILVTAALTYYSTDIAPYVTNPNEEDESDERH